MAEMPLFLKKSRDNCQYKYEMDPNKVLLPKAALTNEQLYERLNEYKEILSVIRHFMKKLLYYMKDTPTLVGVSDAEGNLLEMYGDEMIKDHMKSLGIRTGVCFREEDIGTNSISLALEEKTPIQLIGEDHYHTYLHKSACMTVPFYDLSHQNIVGTISIMTTSDFATSFHMGLLSSAVDSIEREIKLRRQNKTLNLLNQVMMNTTKNGVVMTDVQGNIIEFNKAGETLFGCKKEEVISMSAENLEEISSYITAVLKEQQEFKDCEVEVCSSGKTFICLLDALPIYDEHDNMIGALAQLRDITDRYHLENKIIISEKLSAVGKLAAGIAHEIRNPLAAVIGFVQLLKENRGEEQQTEYHLKIINDELQRINHLVTQFLMMAKPVKPTRVRTNLYKVIEETVQLLNSQALLHNIKIILTAEGNGFFLSVDEMQIKQVIINLIQNAIDAMPDGGKITISLKRNFDKNKVEVHVCDEGEGMSEKQINNISTPFFTTKEKGLGLGLAICHRIIELHKGSLNVFSKKQEGTNFVISLPIG
ncbi:ATP-binding protein [Bacillus taeanensis]|uniref:histidine kinase n=1 Tax=Bacillus taeanensis TaxID=273032 RepID=A0A366XX66_9BACI|nr:ATP-binding protein [Bacillus taeanensis]RBW70732.1 PAS domain-containing sensor histidine kinase [Bacillus taeanensis]